jgi:hypothetical protein
MAQQTCHTGFEARHIHLFASECEGGEEEQIPQRRDVSLGYATLDEGGLSPDDQFA